MRGSKMSADGPTAVSLRLHGRSAIGAPAPEWAGDAASTALQNAGPKTGVRFDLLKSIAMKHER